MISWRTTRIVILCLLVMAGIVALTVATQLTDSTSLTAGLTTDEARVPLLPAPEVIPTPVGAVAPITPLPRFPHVVIAPTPESVFAPRPEPVVPSPTPNFLTSLWLGPVPPTP